MIPGKKFDEDFFCSGAYKDYQGLLKLWVGPVAKRIYRFLKNRQAVKVLDIGCGYGTLLAEFKNRYGFEVAGIECSAYAIKRAPVSVKKKIKKGSILKLPFKKNSFDAVLCFDVIYYVHPKETAQAIKNLVDVSKEYIFFSSLYRHSLEASQKHNPDPLRLPVLSKEEYISLFRKSGAKLVSHFYSQNSEDILVFKK